MDLLEDAFSEFFVKRDIYRKDGEEFVDYEPRFKMLICKLEKALKESGSQGQIPSELVGRYLFNCYMRMEPSDVANVRERAESYKLDHVIAALQKMWSGGGLAAKDQESKMKKKNVASPALTSPSQTAACRSGSVGCLGRPGGLRKLGKICWER